MLCELAGRVRVGERESSQAVDAASDVAVDAGDRQLALVAEFITRLEPGNVPDLGQGSFQLHLLVLESPHVLLFLHM